MAGNQSSLALGRREDTGNFCDFWEVENCSDLSTYRIACSVCWPVASLRHKSHASQWESWWRHHNMCPYCACSKNLSKIGGRAKYAVYKGTIDKTFRSARSLQVLIILANVSCSKSTTILNSIWKWNNRGDVWKKSWVQNVGNLT